MTVWTQSLSFSRYLTYAIPFVSKPGTTAVLKNSLVQLTVFQNLALSNQGKRRYIVPAVEQSPVGVLHPDLKELHAWMSLTTSMFQASAMLTGAKNGGRKGVNHLRGKWLAFMLFEKQLSIYSYGSLRCALGKISELDLPLERDIFLRRLLRELSGTLQDVVGLDDASGYISVVGAAMGEHLDDSYRSALQVQKLDRAQVTDVLIDLKRRIKGDFFVVEATEDKIVLGNRRCPFGEMVHGRPSLCMMTSNVFGHIAAQNLGYAAVELKETIAQGHSGCLVVVHLRANDKLTPATAREYFGTSIGKN